MNQSLPITRLYILLLAVLCTHSVHSANLYNITTSAGLMLDDNLTRAQYERDIYDDRAVFLGISADYSLDISSSSRVNFVATAETWHYANSKLEHQNVSINAAYIIQPDPGYTSPWYSLSLLAGITPYKHNFRDASQLQLSLNTGKRITDSTAYLFGLSRHQSTADHAIFSLTTTRIFANLDLKFNSHTAYTTLAYSTGDFNSTSTPPYPAGEYPWVDDDRVFPGLTDSWTYKVNADSWSFNLGLVYALGSQQSLDGSLLFYSTSGYGNTDYDGMIATLIYFYRF